MMYGVAGAYLSLHRGDLWSKNRGRWCVVGLCLILADRLMANQMWYLNYLGMTVVAAATLMTLPWLSKWQRRNDVLHRMVTLISVISYSMYLLNLTVIQTVGLPVYEKICARCTREPAALYAMYWAATFVGALLLYYGFEQHMTKLRDLMRRKSSAPGAIAGSAT